MISIVCWASLAGAAPPASPEAKTPSVTIAKPAAKPAAEQPAAKPKDVMPAPDLVGVTDDPLLGKGARVNGDEMHGVVAFTFDDGPNPETTPSVIDALEKYDIPATFFIVTQRLLGKHGEKSREILARELTGGFLVGDHSMTHINLRKSAGKALDKEIDQSIRTLAKEASRPIGLFRPPYGALSAAGRVRLKKLGVTEVIWSIDTLDWRAHNEQKLRKKVVSMIEKENGGIVLMHDVKPITAKVISEVLDDLEAENCQRLKEQKEPIVPVSIHYFLRDGKTPRAIPDAVQKRTAAYKAALPTRCAARPPLPAPPPPPAKPASSVVAKPPTSSTPKRQIGDFPDKGCLENPLAKGCQ
ncbi:MAG: polysaccharide deacetylase family protein [Myxococcales bacterium]|nr:polysaccharide deacetylase family protein [Myxococcales bacterium]